MPQRARFPNVSRSQPSRLERGGADRNCEVINCLKLTEGLMKNRILIAALAVGWSFAMGTPAAAAVKTYDCTKAGNANKAACKNATQAAAKAAAKPAKAGLAP